MEQYEKIGIMGGMGPESTALLYRNIIRSFQTEFNAYKDDDFPEIIIHNLPIPDITENTLNENKVRRMLSKSVHFLEDSDVDFIAFPCNSLDYFTDHLVSETNVPLLSIVKETCGEIEKTNADEILLLSTPTTFEKGLYQRFLTDKKIVRPKKYMEIHNIIIRTLRGDKPKDEFIEKLEKEYSAYDSILIGCTDLSVLVDDYRNDRLIDSLSCLSNSVFQKSTQRYKSED